MQDETLRHILDQFSFFKIFWGIFLFCLTLGFMRLLRLVADLLAARFGRYRLFISSAFPVLRLGLWIFATGFIIFVVLHPPLNTLVAISASVGLAVGLGAQDLIKNVIAGILILLDRPFRVGDMVQVGEHYGEVTGIGLRSIRVHTFDDSAVTLPNSLVLGQAVSNSNNGAIDEMVVVEFSLPASVNIQQVKELAREAAACSPYVYLKKPIAIIIDDHFDRTFLTRIKIKAYVLDVRLERLMASDITERLKQELTRRGVLGEQQVLGLLTAG